MQSAGEHLLVEIGVEDHPIRHQRQREDESPLVARADLAAGDGDLAHVLALEPEEGAAVGELEPHAVRVVQGDVGVQADVEVDAESGHVDGEIEVGDGDGVDGDDGLLGLEHGDGEDEDEEC